MQQAGKTHSVLRILLVWYNLNPYGRFLNNYFILLLDSRKSMMEIVLTSFVKNYKVSIKLFTMGK